MLYDKKWDKEIKTEEPWRQHLRAAAAYIRQHGWCRGGTEDDLGRVCLLGALMKTETMVASQVSSLQLRKLIDVSITCWNDRICKSKEQAVAMLEAAAEMEAQMLER